MKKIKKYKGSFFDDFFVTTDKAKNQAEINDCIMEFEFNSRTCRVSKDTNAEWLFRDYLNSYIMGWKTVGPDCVEKYDADLQKEYEKLKAISDGKELNRMAEYRENERLQKEIFNKSVEGIELKLSNPDGWKQAREANTDGYGGAALDYAEGWAKLMQIEIAKGKTVSECFDYTQSGLGFLGITGFQFGCAVSTLSQTWKYGDELRKAHNKKYGINEDESGIVNPAVLTISTK